MIDLIALEASFNLLNLQRLSSNTWWVNCTKNRNNKPYKATLRIYKESVRYKQTYYYQTDLSTLFKRIGKDIKGITK